MFDLPERVSDDELKRVLQQALRAGGGGVSRMTELEMAGIVARHVVNGLAVAGIIAMRMPEGLRLKD